MYSIIFVNVGYLVLGFTVAYYIHPVDVHVRMGLDMYSSYFTVIICITGTCLT